MVFCISGPLVHALNIYVFVLVAPYVSHILWAKNERVLLNCAPTSTKLHPPPPNSFQPLPSSLQHPKKYSNQSIRNWAISPNLDRKIQRSSFWLRNGSHSILEVLIPNPDLRFLKFQLQNPFLGKFRFKKTKLSIDTHGISRKLILISTLVFWISNQKSIFSKFAPKKSKLSVLSENRHTWYLGDADSYFNISFPNFKPKTDFWPNLGQKSQICPFCLKTWYLADADSYSEISFLNFKT